MDEHCRQLEHENFWPGGSVEGLPPAHCRSRFETLHHYLIYASAIEYHTSFMGTFGAARVIYLIGVVIHGFHATHHDASLEHS